MSQIKSLSTGIKFKDTPIGKIPVDWETVRLEKVSFMEYGASLPERERHRGTIKVYGSNGIVGYHNKKLVEGPGIIIGRKGTAGAVTWSEEDFWPIDTTYFISKNECNENLKWFFYLLSSLHLENLNAATGIPGLNRSTAHSLNIPLPPLSEQKKIAEILTTVDDAIEETDWIIEKTKELKKGLMQKLFTRGIGHKKFKKTEIGKIPVEWEVVKLDKVVKEFYNGGTPDTKVKEYWGGDIPWVTGADFTNQRIEQTRRYITIQGVKNSATNVIPRGNLLVVTRTGVGKLAIAPFDIAISQDITGVITNTKKLLPDFLYRFLDYHEKKLKSFVQGTSINGLLREDLASLNICLPPLKEQKEIADILTTVDLEIDNEEINKQNLETLKKSLMQVLLTGRVRVKLQ